MSGNEKEKIIIEISNLSNALGEIKSEEDAVKQARDSFLKLSMLVGKVLDIKFD